MVLHPTVLHPKSLVSSCLNILKAGIVGVFHCVWPLNVFFTGLVYQRALTSIIFPVLSNLRIMMKITKLMSHISTKRSLAHIHFEARKAILTVAGSVSCCAQLCHLSGAGGDTEHPEIYQLLGQYSFETPMNSVLCLSLSKISLLRVSS